ncbi:MAG TPA: GIY-YIG nuclease family protein [Burkholderiaceae bacterium]|jgi:hypothetical protein
MTAGFIYVLLNPAFPQMVKIGRTHKGTQTRSRKISSATGVPLDFIVLYDALVSDPIATEKILHARFAEHRVAKRKEFFYVPPKQAISALVEIADELRVDASKIQFADDLLPMLHAKFPNKVDPSIFSVRLAAVPGTAYLRVGRRQGGRDTYSDEDLPLSGLATPEVLTADDAAHNAKLLASLDDYSWIMVSNIFPMPVAEEIALAWERPGGKLDTLRDARTA